MRIDHIQLKNFKGFVDARFDFHPQFNLIVGENGAGKTSLLDGLAVAAGIWLAEPPDSSLISSGRNIYPNEIRLVGVREGDRLQFRETGEGVSVKATGRIGETEGVEWTRQVRAGGRRTTNADAKPAQRIIADYFKRDAARERIAFPLVAYYGAGRAWLPSRDRSKSKAKKRPAAMRWAAFYDSLFERIRPAELQAWFAAEAIATGNRSGRSRPGYEVVRHAVLSCVPGSDDLYYDGDRKEVVFSIHKRAQPFSNLSAGQRMLLMLVADLAVKAVTQNNYLVPADELHAEDSPTPRVLQETPGVVLIDELDIHLHPAWQRGVIADLKRTFPAIQFFATTHSPQIVSETPSGEIILLKRDGSWNRPGQSLGLDSNEVLKDIMHADTINKAAAADLDALDQFLADAEFERARDKIADLRRTYGELVRLAGAEAYMARMEILADREEGK
jgi:predicted ATP-binding protein involved in virulence